MYVIAVWSFYAYGFLLGTCLVLDAVFLFPSLTTSDVALDVGIRIQGQRKKMCGCRNAIPIPMDMETNQCRHYSCSSELILRAETLVASPK